MLSIFADSSLLPLCSCTQECYMLPPKGCYLTVVFVLVLYTEGEFLEIQKQLVQV